MDEVAIDDNMTQEEQALLKALDNLVRSKPVRVQIEPIVKRVRAKLARKQNALMAWEPIAPAIFGKQLPGSIRSGWVFILRAGANTGAERHPNSHQRMMTFSGTGDMQTDVKSTPSEVNAEAEIQWQSNVLVSDAGAPLEQRWISIPQNVWHRPVVRSGAGWVVVSFHTVPAAELIEERPGAKQMRYLDKLDH